MSAYAAPKDGVPERHTRKSYFHTLVFENSRGHKAEGTTSVPRCRRGPEPTRTALNLAALPKHGIILMSGGSEIETLPVRI